MIVQLSGNHVGILLSTRHWQGDSNDAFFLWDWTTGLVKGVSTYRSTFASPQIARREGDVHYPSFADDVF